MVVAFGDRVLQVMDLHVLVEVDEGLVVGMREDRPGDVRRRRRVVVGGGGGGAGCIRLGARVEAGGLRGLPAGAAPVRDRRVEARDSGDPARGENP